MNTCETMRLLRKGGGGLTTNTNLEQIVLKLSKSVRQKSKDRQS